MRTFFVETTRFSEWIHPETEAANTPTEFRIDYIANHDTQNLVSSVAWMVQAMFAENADEDYSGKFFIEHQAGTSLVK